MCIVGFNRPRNHTVVCHFKLNVGASIARTRNEIIKYSILKINNIYDLLIFRIVQNIKHVI